MTEDHSIRMSSALCMQFYVDIQSLLISQWHFINVVVINDSSKCSIFV